MSEPYALAAQAKLCISDPDSHQALVKAGEVWRQHQNQQKRYWSDWTEIIGPALVCAQTEAMIIAKVVKPEGRRYAEVMSNLLRAYDLADMDDATRHHAIHIMQNLNTVSAWRMKQKDSERLNHPTTIWRQYVKSEDYAAAEHERPRRQSQKSPKPVQKELEATQAELEARNADYERLKAENDELRRRREPEFTSAEIPDDLSIPLPFRRASYDDICDAVRTLISACPLERRHMPDDVNPDDLIELAEELNAIAAAMTEADRKQRQHVN